MARIILILALPEPFQIIMGFILGYDTKRFLIGRKAMINLDSILKSRDITLLTKVRLVKVFPLVTYGCESWTIEKAEHWRIDALELWCWRRLLRVPWTARRSNLPILKDISPEYSLEGMNFSWNSAEAEILILCPPDRKSWLIGKDPDSRKDWGQEEKEVTKDEMVGWHHWTWVWQALRDNKGQGSLALCSPWGHKELDMT